MTFCCIFIFIPLPETCICRRIKDINQQPQPQQYAAYENLFNTRSQVFENENGPNNRWVELSPTNLASVIDNVKHYQQQQQQPSPTKKSLSITKEKKTAIISGDRKSTLRKEASILGNPKPSFENEGKVDHLLGFAHHENLVGQNGDLIETDVPPVTVNLLPTNNKNDGGGEGEVENETKDVSGTGRSQFMSFVDNKPASPKYALRQIFNDSTSKIISQGKIDPYQKPIARNLLLPSEVDKQEKRFEDLFLRHKSQYDGLNIYKQTRNDYEQFEKLDSSPLRHHHKASLLSGKTNKRNGGGGGKHEAENRELKEAAALDEKIETLKGLILMKHSKGDDNKGDDNKGDNSISKQDKDNYGWVGKAYSKLKNGNTLHDDVEAKKKLYQKLKTQVLFNPNSKSDKDSDLKDNSLGSESKYATKQEDDGEDTTEIEKSSEDEFQQYQRQQGIGENEEDGGNAPILALDQKFLRKSDDDVNFPTKEEEKKNEKEEFSNFKPLSLKESKKKKKLTALGININFEKQKSQNNDERELENNDETGVNDNDNEEEDDAKTTATNLEVTPKPKKPDDRLPSPTTTTEIKPKPPKKSQQKPKDPLPAEDLKPPSPTAGKPDPLPDKDLKTARKPEDLKPGDPLEDKFRPIGVAALKPQEMVSKQSNLLFSYDDGAEDGKFSFVKANNPPTS